MANKNLVRQEDRELKSRDFSSWPMNRFFNQWWNELWPSPWNFLEKQWASPRVDVCEDNNQITVHAELPGMDENDIQISLSKDRLILQGEKKEEVEENERGFHRHERTFGSVYREIDLPSEVDVDQARAEFKNGILTMTLPKSEEAQKTMKQIPINA